MSVPGVILRRPPTAAGSIDYSLLAGAESFAPPSSLQTTVSDSSSNSSSGISSDEEDESRVAQVHKSAKEQAWPGPNKVSQVGVRL